MSFKVVGLWRSTTTTTTRLLVEINVGKELAYSQELIQLGLALATLTVLTSSQALECTSPVETNDHMRLHQFLIDLEGEEMDV